MALTQRAEMTQRQFLSLIYQDMEAILKTLKAIKRKLESNWLVVSIVDELNFIKDTLCPRLSAALDNLKNFVSTQTVIVYIDGIRERIRFLSIWAENWITKVTVKKVNEIAIKNEMLHTGLPNIAATHLKDCFTAYSQLRRDPSLSPYLIDIRTLRTELVVIEKRAA